MTLVAGIDTSTQSCKVMVVEAESGRVVGEGTAGHPDGTECHPNAWWDAFIRAAQQVGGLENVSALSVAGQQHGLVLLGADGEVIRPAQLWNDTLSSSCSQDLKDELGTETWVQATGLVLVPSFTVTKLRWIADNEPDNAARIAAICLPHDWLTWKLRGAQDLSTLVTDRSDASGTGYFDAVTNQYRRDLLAHALRRDEAGIAHIMLPRVLAPSENAGPGDPHLGLGHAIVGPGCGDNAGAALGLSHTPGQVTVSIGTSGVVCAVSATPVRDPSGLVAGFADALGGYLPLTATINGARILSGAARVLGVDFTGLDELALSARPGAGGLVMIPHFDGERTPNLPDSTGSLTGITLANLTPENFARASIEGLLCLIGVGMAAQRAQGVRIDSVTLIGGGARSRAVRQLAPAVLGVDVEVPSPGQYVALGAARQAAWLISGEPQPPTWKTVDSQTFTAEPTPWVQQRYDRVATQVAGISPR